MLISDALNNLFAAKLRAFLAILGILVGTASVVALVSSGEMATQAALAEFKLLGTDLMSVTVYSAKRQTLTKPKQLTLSVVKALAKQEPAIKQIAPYTSLFLPLVYAGKMIKGSIIGSTEALATAIKIKLAAGRFVSDLDQNNHFAVVGSQVAKQLRHHGMLTPLGKQLQIGSEIFTIIGVIKPWPENNFFNQNINRAVIIPIQASLSLVSYTQINNLVIKLLPDSAIDEVIKNINSFIAQQVPGMRTFTRSARQIIKSMSEQHKTFTLLLGLIGGIALIVGGIGVMNIMLVSVTERQREIGIRLALGARRCDVQSLFLTEAIVLALLGGMMGVLLGVLASYIISLVSHWQFELLGLPILIGFAVSAATGIFFGFYPAYRAAKLDPIECLRTE